MVVVAVISDATVASALIGRWASSRDRADARRGRGAWSSLLARAALRALLAQHTGHADWQILRTRLGKPFVVGPSGALGPAVSLSHTGAMVAVAMAQAGALGVDIEQHRTRDFTALAAQAFGPAEQADVAVSGADAFYRIWTSREAIAKATGDGLALAANGHDLVAGGASEPYRRMEHGGHVWHLAHVRIEPDCSLAVAHAGTPEGTWALRWSDLGAPALGSLA
jgi:4'-phosphopantetheinyl transferase